MRPVELFLDPEFIGTLANVIKEFQNIPVIDKYIEVHEFTTREIYLPYVLDMDDSSCIIQKIRYYNSEDEAKNIPVEERMPIKVFVNCAGGDVSEGMAIADAIQLSKTPVHTIVTGVAYSMAGYVLLAGHKRFAYPSATYLVHSGSTTLINCNTADARDHMKFNERYENEYVNKLMFDRTTITEEEYARTERTQWYLTVDDMLKYKVIDEVITSL